VNVQFREALWDQLLLASLVSSSDSSGSAIDSGKLLHTVAATMLPFGVQVLKLKKRAITFSRIHPNGY
jgi:hypothetical protein